jgi:CMP-N-acetylneuraminic acid synthetase
VTTADRPRVTVYIPCRNYGAFLAQAIESVVGQSYTYWELIVIDDGSADETGEVAERYAARHPERVRVVRHTTAQGLPACANRALEEARGDYIIRLDADDFFDESALLVLVNCLDRHPEVGLVYPNYTYVDERGTPLGVENRKKIGTEAKLLDLPAHGACTLIRKRILKSVGGYDERYDAQDGHELWLKVLHRYEVANVSTPLFFYRQHGKSVSREEARLLSARQRIKEGLASRAGGRGPRMVAVVPAKNTLDNFPGIVLEEFAGRPLIDYTLDAARESGRFETIVVTTDDPKVIEYCAEFPDVLATMRPLDLSLPHVHLSQVLHDAVRRLEQEHAIYPDILVLLNLHCPLREARHIGEAIDTLVLYNADNVISVFECDDVHFTHGENGLQPLNKGMLQRVRLEREVLYVDNGAINAVWRDVISETSIYGTRIGHVLMPAEASYRVKSTLNAWIIEHLIGHQRTAAASVPPGDGAGGARR